MRELIGFFKWSILATLAGLAAAWLYGGTGALVIVALLIALEASISFDNAVVNATVLRRMSERWQTVFLTVGIAIAVFGMRVLFPIAIVAVATALTFTEVVDQALNNQDAYARNVEEAAPIIGSFGGTFLLLVSLSYLLDPNRDVHWIGPAERQMSRAGGIPALPTAIVGAVLIGVSQFLAPESEADVLLAGLVGIVVFLVVRGVRELMEDRIGGGEGNKATGAAGFASFLYLEMLDASFSLDGVLGAFAITTDIVLVALGLGVGAIYIRSLTVYLVRRKTLRAYRYLTNGAHWAIGALGVFLYASIKTHPPEWLTGGIGLGLILAAFISSVIHNRRHGKDGEEEGEGDEEEPGEADEAAGDGARREERERTAG